MVHQWGFFGSISAIRKIWSLTANSRSLQAAALNKSQGPVRYKSRGPLVSEFSNEFCLFVEKSGARQQAMFISYSERGLLVAIEIIFMISFETLAFKAHTCTSTFVLSRGLAVKRK